MLRILRARAAVGALVIGTIAVATVARQEEKPKADGWQALQEAWKTQRKEAMQRLAPLVGEWQANGTYGEAKQDGTYDEQHGTWSNTWLFEGEHLQMTFDVKVNGKRRRYMCVMSYDPAHSQYETVWVGDSGYRFTETGKFDREGKSLMLTSMQERPGLSGPVRVTSVFSFAEPDLIMVDDYTRHPDSRKSEPSFSVILKRAKKK